MTPEQQGGDGTTRAIIDGLEFTSGVIEAEIAGAVAPGAAEGARGFVGIAFRARRTATSTRFTCDRPTVVPRTRSGGTTCAVLSHPDWPWFRLRKERRRATSRTPILCPAPGRDQSKCAASARVSTSMAEEQPALIVNDVKSGPSGKAGSHSGWIAARSRTSGT